MAETKNTPCVLIIRDGWGENPNPEHDGFNAVKRAKTPASDRLMGEWPKTLIRTSGRDVGLPEGAMGNSEVGHQNIGAGRIVDQESVRITRAIEDGSFFQNEAIKGAIQKAKKRGGAVHIMGLASDAGVHSLLEHLFACVKACKREDMERVLVHCFTDGRDTGPFTGKRIVERIERELSDIGVGTVASICGRYYAMDRDNRWERVKRAYDLLTQRGDGYRRFDTASDAITDYYENPSSETQKGDEFITPRLVGSPPAVSDGDSVIFFNFRGDRPRELTRAFVFDDFHGHVKESPDSGEKGFDRGEKIELSAYVTMTAYAEDLNEFVDVAFPKPPKMKRIAGEYLSGLGLTQFRCAETEKFPHVTFFFNDYRDEPFEGENREIIQSPKVATYDMQPEMSAPGVRDAVMGRLNAEDCEPFIVVNFANPDMVGHTGSLEAAVKACEAVDQCVGAIVDRVLELGGSAIVTADHGNAEQMWDTENDCPHTAHTTYDVPLIVVGEAFKGRKLREKGRLADIVPTMLEMMGVEKPGEMTGASLLER